MDYETWCNRSDHELHQLDLAEINLIAAIGLPGAEILDVAAHLRKIDEWAGLVEYGIHRMWHRRSSKEYAELSPNQFRMLTLVTILQRNLGIRYNPDCITGEFDSRDPRNHFIHGLLLGCGGTCSSLPFLYVVIGRRLGFPLFLVQAKEHLFVRWEGDGDRFNIEATALGFQPYDDLHYRRSPRPISDGEVRTFPRILQNMTPREELACCLAQRAQVFFDNLKLGKAVLACYFAHLLAPQYEGQWAVLTMALATAKRMRNCDSTLSWKDLVTTAAPRPRNRPERWAIEEAKKHLIRAVSIRRAPPPESRDLFFASLE